MMLNRYCLHKKERAHGLASSGRMMSVLILDRFVLHYPKSQISKILAGYSRLSHQEIRSYYVNSDLQNIDLSPLVKFERKEFGEDFFRAIYDCIDINCGFNTGIPGHALRFSAPGLDDVKKELKKKTLAIYDTFAYPESSYPKWVPTPGTKVEKKVAGPSEDEPYQRLVFKYPAKPASESIWCQPYHSSKYCVGADRNVQS